VEPPDPRPYRLFMWTFIPSIALGALGFIIMIIGGASLPLSSEVASSGFAVSAALFVVAFIGIGWMAVDRAKRENRYWRLRKAGTLPRAARTRIRPDRRAIFWSTVGLVIALIWVYLDWRAHSVR